MDRSNVLLAGAVIAGMVLLPGMAKFTLTSMGYGDLGTIVYAVGYALGVVVIWLKWIRPLDLSGPVTAGQPEEIDASETDG